MTTAYAGNGHHVQARFISQRHLTRLTDSCREASNDPDGFMQRSAQRLKECNDKAAAAQERTSKAQHILDTANFDARKSSIQVLLATCLLRVQAPVHVGHAHTCH